MGNLFEGRENKTENPVVQCSMSTAYKTAYKRAHAFTVHILMNRFLHSQHTLTYNV